MYTFSAKSREHLLNARGGLRSVMNLALGRGVIDFAIIESIRDQGEQNRLYALDRSKVQWPDSKQNVRDPDELCRALDAVPFVDGKVSWNHLHCCVLAGVILSAASAVGVRVRWGGDWNMNGEPITDQEFQDLVHYEEVEK